MPVWGTILELFELNSLKRHIWFDPNPRQLRSGTQHNDLHFNQLEWRDVCYKQRRFSIQPSDRSSTSQPNKHQKIKSAHKAFWLVGYECTSLSSWQPWGAFRGKTASEWQGRAGGLLHQVQVSNLRSTTGVKREIKVTEQVRGRYHKLLHTVFHFYFSKYPNMSKYSFISCFECV